MPSGLDVSRGTVFWREPPDQRPHHWVVLTDPVCIDGTQQVVWVSLSSVKSYLTYPDGTFTFNVGKSTSTWIRNATAHPT